MLMLRRSATAILICCLTAACLDQSRIEGVVEDNFGKPLSGVEVSIKNSAFKSQTDVKGWYSVEFVPGKILVDYAKDDYWENSLTLDIATKSRYPAAKVTLTKKVPMGAMLYRMGDDYFQTSACDTKEEVISGNPSIIVRRAIFNPSINSPTKFTAAPKRLELWDTSTLNGRMTGIYKLSHLNSASPGPSMLNVIQVVNVRSSERQDFQIPFVAKQAAVGRFVSFDVQPARYAIVGMVSNSFGAEPFPGMGLPCFVFDVLS